MIAPVVVTPGDPRGIGPEVALRSLDLLAGESAGPTVSIIGPEGPMSPNELARVATQARTFGDADAGAWAARAIEYAVGLALENETRAIVTAPLHKPSLHAAGRRFPGQTEMLAHLSGAPRVGMLMAAERTRLEGPLRVLLATTHLPLRAVADSVTTTLLDDQIALLDEALRTDWGLAAPRIVVCALNPHASDGGLFGDEEARVFMPAVHSARTRGIDVSGPFPADTVFGRALAGGFDAVVAPYHDVGMAAFKTVAFGSGVNVTLGLPFVRTSPDHGTAFDIAGTGSADPASMTEAILLASRLSRNRFDTPPAHA